MDYLSPRETTLLRLGMTEGGKNTNFPRNVLIDGDTTDVQAVKFGEKHGKLGKFDWRGR